jgi:hypothetical protein
MLRRDVTIRRTRSKSGLPKVPSAFGLSAPAQTTCGKFAGVSVSDPDILRQGAFCSLRVLQLRRFEHSQTGQFSRTIFWADFKELTAHSSDSQAVDKNRDDRPKAWRIIKE